MSGRAIFPVNAGRGMGGGAQRPPMDMPLDVPRHMLLEEKVASQHEKMLRILTENQRLAATHVALRQELAAAQQELQQMKQVFGGIQAEREQQVRGLAEKLAKTEAELQGAESLRTEIQKTQTESQKLLAFREEVGVQIQQLTRELHLARTEVQQVPAMKNEIEALRQEIPRARAAFELEKKANTELLDQRQAMEKDLVSMAREVEKLRASLTNVEKKSIGGAYAGGFADRESGGYNLNAYSEKYGRTQIPPENGPPLGSQSGPASAWGSYNLPQGGGPLPRR